MPRANQKEFASTRLTAALIQQVRRLALDEKRTLSQMIRLLIEEAVEKRRTNGRKEA